MPRPVTPFVGCDVFVVNERKEVLLIKRSDNGFWALPGGAHDLGETPARTAARECFEETGLKVEITSLLGLWSSNCYEYVNYPWKENEFVHVLYAARVTGGVLRGSAESLEVGWFTEVALPPLSDGHLVRIEFGFRSMRDQALPAYFE